MDFKIGSFLQPLSTGEQVITGVGFTPKVVILQMTHLTADGTAPEINFSHGVSTAVAQQLSFSGSVRDGSNSGGGRIEARATHLIENASQTTALADLTSLDADGFTLDWENAGTAVVVHYICIGGDDLSADQELLTSPASTGTQVITAAFEAVGVLFTGSHEDDAIPDHDVNNWQLFGAALDAANEVVSANSVASGNDAQQTQLSTRCIATLDVLTDATTEEAQFDSKSATDFTIDWTKVDAQAYVHTWLALAGIQIKVGTFSLATSTGLQAITGVGFKPEGLILFSNAAAASAIPVIHANLCSGAASSSTERFVIAGNAPDGDNTPKDISMSRAHIFQAITSGTPTIDAEADLESLDAGGFTLDIETASAISYEVHYVAFATEGVVPDPSVTNTGTIDCNVTDEATI